MGFVGVLDSDSKFCRLYIELSKSAIEASQFASIAVQFILMRGLFNEFKDHGMLC